MGTRAATSFPFLVKDNPDSLRKQLGLIPRRISNELRGRRSYPCVILLDSLSAGWLGLPYLAVSISFLAVGDLHNQDD